MRSDLQIQASRANGRKSRGPVTEEGKRASSRNAVKHGILAEHLLVCTERHDTFTELVTALYDEFQPATAFEESLVDTMAVARWRQQRIWNIEREAINSGIYSAHDRNRAAMLSPGVLTSMAFGNLASETRTLDLVNRYESRFDRQYLRAHTRLLAVQESRMRNEPRPTPPPAPAPGPQLVPNAPADPTAPGVSEGKSSFTKRTQGETVKGHSQWLETFICPDFDPPPLVFHATQAPTQL